MLGVPSLLATDAEAKAKAASPVNYIATNGPPVLIVHGSMDDLVPIAQSRQLHTALDRAGVQNRLLEVPGAGHDGPMFSTPEIESATAGF